MMLLLVILPFIALANENDTKKRNLLAGEEKRGLADSISIEEVGAFSGSAFEILARSAAASKPNDRQRLPTHSKPDKCATGSPGRYRPRNGASNCAKTSAKKSKSAIGDEDADPYLSADPRSQHFSEDIVGVYNLKVMCSDDQSASHDDFNINAWFQVKPLDSIELQSLEGRESEAENQDRHLGTEPMSTPGPDSLERIRSLQGGCRAAMEDKCHEARRRACDAQHQGIDDAANHIELTHRIHEYLACENKHQSWGDCDGERKGYATYEFWKQEEIDGLHLNTNMPLGVNIVPEDDTNDRADATEECINFAVTQMCLAHQPCGEDGSASCKCDGKACTLKEYCQSHYRQEAKPRLIHQEGGNGSRHTDSKGQWVPETCVDPNATWVTLLWENTSAPAKGSMTVFGCPSKGFEGCGTDCEPFQSWKGWLTTSTIHRTNFSDNERFCTLWHQQQELAGLYKDNSDPKLEGEYRSTGYLNPQVCHKKDNPTPFDKCDILSPDDCHFQADTKFDPEFGHFYHDNDFKVVKKWWPYWSDRLDWREMLPVCFGCDFDKCGGNDNDTGKGVCTDDLYDHRDRAGSPTQTPFWMQRGIPRSPLQQMHRPSGRAVVRDQGSCGSCWAFASMTTASHLTCIADCKQNGRCLYDNIMSGDNFLEPMQFSVQSALSCNSVRRGCGGGWMSNSDQVYIDYGVMKEQNFPCKQAVAKDAAPGFGSQATLLDSCEKNYQYACKNGGCRSTVAAHDGSSSCTGGNPNPANWNTPGPEHGNICQNQWGASCPYSWDYWQYPATPNWAQHTGVYNMKRVHVNSHYSVGLSEAQYKVHLFHKGPFAVAFMVYNDFPWNGCSAATDADHVYTVGPNASQRGGHGVTMVGYGWAYNNCSGCTAGRGCEPGWKKYWMIQNSWGRNWGQDGYFRIERGTDEARIESWGATATDIDVNCQDDKWYGGKINYPRRNKLSPHMDKFVNLMETVKPSAAPSQECPAAHWYKKHDHLIQGFEIVTHIKDLTGGPKDVIA